jgi:hypothetical protein
MGSAPRFRPRQHGADNVIGRAGIAALAMLITIGAAQPSPAIGDDYAAIVRAYYEDDADVAVGRLVAVDRDRLEGELRIFFTGPPASLVAAAAALHTEVALRPRVAMTLELADLHLRFAASIVEVGQTPKARRLAAVGLKPSVVRAEETFASPRLLDLGAGARRSVLEHAEEYYEHNWRST